MARETKPDWKWPGKHYFQKKLPLSGETISTRTSLHDRYHGQEEAARRAAKRKVNRQMRRKENAATQRLTDNPEDA